jgi:hypothetical protein
MIEFQPNITDAIVNLRPGAEWALSGDTYGGLNWLDKIQTKPSQEEITAELLKLQTEYDSKEYRRLRAKEYPPVTDYLDAVVKGDLEQQQAYVDACLAVKAKYPKPEGV